MAITTHQAPVYFSENAYQQLNSFLERINHSVIFILVDSNTQNFCLNAFLQKMVTESPIEVIEMDAGEQFKNIETCSGIWNVLSELNGDRKSLIINLGGGVVTDLGGFVASTFKRGISYINIPTSLLAMVDASVGGKTGVDLGTLKNQIGVITQPEMVLIDPTYLSTLSAKEMRSGLAEILKHGLIANEAYWQKATNLENLGLDDLEALIKESVSIKSTIVTEDPLEKNVRKSLNYGHTLGHAIESYFLSHEHKNTLLHGEAIAIGMILATHISTNLLDFPENKLKNITEKLSDIYPKVNFEADDIEHIIELLKFDKKNEYGKINFVLLKDIGKPILDQKVNNDLIINAFEYYRVN